MSDKVLIEKTSKKLKLLSVVGLVVFISAVILSVYAQTNNITVLEWVGRILTVIGFVFTVVVRALIFWHHD